VYILLRSLQYVDISNSIASSKPTIRSFMIQNLHIVFAIDVPVLINLKMLQVNFELSTSYEARWILQKDFVQI